MANNGYYALTNEIVPEYDLEEIWEWFESPDQTKGRRAEVISEIECKSEAKRVMDPLYERTVAKLRKCEEGFPCNTPVCAVCMSSFRRVYVSHGLKAFEDYNRIYFVTWVPDPQHGSLYKFSPRNLQRKFQRMIVDRLGAEVADKIRVWGCVESKFDRKLKVFVPHIHCIVGGCHKDQLRKLVKLERNPETRKMVLPPDRIIQKPLVIKRVKRKERVAVFSYVCKPYFESKRFFTKYVPKRPPSAARQAGLLELERRKLIELHERRTPVFTKEGYRKLLRQRFRAVGVRDLPDKVDHMVFLGNIALNDVCVLRGIKRMKPYQFALTTRRLGNVRVGNSSWST